MIEAGIPVYDHYPENFANNPIFSTEELKKHYPVVEHLMQHTLSLPIDSWITAKEVSIVAETLDKVLESNNLYYEH